MVRCYYATIHCESLLSMWRMIESKALWVKKQKQKKKTDSHGWMVTQGRKKERQTVLVRESEPHTPLSSQEEGRRHREASSR